VVSFAGDAIMGWFDDDRFEGSILQFDRSNPQDAERTTHDSAALRAVSCAIALQRAVGRLAAIDLPGGSGAVQRFVVGEPSIQTLDVAYANAQMRSVIGVAAIEGTAPHTHAEHLEQQR
jgi:hypothetical protein